MPRCRRGGTGRRRGPGAPGRAADAGADGGAEQGKRRGPGAPSPWLLGLQGATRTAGGAPGRRGGGGGRVGGRGASVSARREGLRTRRPKPSVSDVALLWPRHHFCARGVLLRTWCPFAHAALFCARDARKERARLGGRSQTAIDFTLTRPSSCAVQRRVGFRVTP